MKQQHRKSSLPSPTSRKTTAATAATASPAGSAASSAKSPTNDVSAAVPLSRAAYLCVKDNVAEDLTSLEEFECALQHAGYNPTGQWLDRYWSPDTNCVTYQQFHHILQTEPLPRKLDLISYFQKLDLTGDGLIPHHDFLTAMTTRGQKLSKESILKLFQNPAYNRDGRFDYHAFCQNVFETSAQLTRLAKEAAAADVQENNVMAVNSKTYKVKRKLSSPVKSDRSSWSCSKSKGAFYFEGDTIISHQFVLKVKKDGFHDISIQPHENCANPVDCRIFLFRLLDDNGSRSPDSKYQLIGRSPLVLSANFVSNESLDANRSWSGRLEKGTYLLIPSTTGCKFRKRRKQPTSDIKLVRHVGGRVELTDRFSQVLREIFAQVDLDHSQSLSRVEFNLFNWRTSGEEVQDDEWKVVQDNFKLKDGQLTLEGFLQLHTMEAEDNGGDSAELWITLNAMGYNVGLQQDEASIFELFVRSEEDDNGELEVSGLRSGGSLLDKAMNKAIMEEAGKVKRVEKKEDLVLYREDSATCTSFVIQNRSATTSVSVNMDFSASKNVLIDHPHFAFTTKLSARSTLFVAHLVPKEIMHDHMVVLKETLL